jgi:hypothetical protein
MQHMQSVTVLMHQDDKFQFIFPNIRLHKALINAPQVVSCILTAALQGCEYVFIYIKRPAKEKR